VTVADLKAAVIGVGAMGQHHARIYDQMPTVQLVGVADASAEAGQRIAQLRHTVAYTDYRRLLGEARPDVISVALPTEFHHQVALDALEAGCHVLIEKPIAATEEQALELIEHADVLGRKLMAATGAVSCSRPGRWCSH
jgi:UDP-N-acetylglucosamine 3-dehydrogenase